jgi:carbonic anhydrase
MNLISGYKKFLEKYFKHKPELYEKLVHVQSPETLFLACCDSRIDPAILTSAEPGELFVVRNIANYVPRYVSRSQESEAMTAIEFAVCNLHIKTIIVLGHQNCAGIRAIANGARNEILSNFPSVWKEQRSRLHDLVKEPYTQETAVVFEKENIKLACHDLLTYPFIKERVDQNKLLVVGWYFHLETGTIEVYNPEQRSFKVLET